MKAPALKTAPARATMNFFERQDKARFRTGLLVVLFAVAVLLIAVGVSAAVFFTFFFSGGKMPSDGEIFLIFIAAALGTFLFIGGASWYRVASLSKGGSKVAEMLGGRLVSRGAKSIEERRLIDVVEEMAIASGVPVPQVYVLDGEDGINAFAAGFTSSDAAVAVTAGCLRQLSRDELQGVVAHEFSHVLNGDMRLNIRLMGILFGILAIGIIGRVVLRGSRKKGALLGLLLFLIGYIGLFIGRIIQAAVSRQREYLADASAVQFTRNPGGIGGALRKIGGFAGGSKVKNGSAEEAAHMFFGSLGLSLIFSTHPPLAKRIEAIEGLPFAGEEGVSAAQPFAAAGDSAVLSGLAEATPPPQVASDQAPAPAPEGLPPAFAMGIDPADVVTMVGRPTERHVEHAHDLLAALPQGVKDALAAPATAKLSIYALLLSRDEADRARQIESLERTLETAEIEQVRRIFSDLEDLDPRARLPLADIAYPALRRIEVKELAGFFDTVEVLIASDGCVTLFEFAIQRTLTYRLRTAANRQGRVRRTGSAADRQRDVLTLLAAVARAGNAADAAAARAAFEAGTARMKDLEPLAASFAIPQAYEFGDVSRALDRLPQTPFAFRQQVIDACAHCAFDDRVVRLAEAELLRVISMSLDCPLPPFLAEEN